MMRTRGSEITIQEGWEASRKGGRSGRRRCGLGRDSIPEGEGDAKEGEEHADEAERPRHLDYFDWILISCSSRYRLFASSK